MSSEDYRLSFHEARGLLVRRLSEPAPARIQLLAGPRQVGKTTLLLELSEQHGNAAIYAAADGPEAALPGFWERLWVRAAETASREGIGEFVRRHAKFRPLVVCDDEARPVAERAGLEAMPWTDFLLDGPPGSTARG
jgi:hypothetical protein